MVMSCMACRITCAPADLGETGAQTIDDVGGAGGASVFARAQADVDLRLRRAAGVVMRFIDVGIGADDLHRLDGFAGSCIREREPCGATTVPCRKPVSCWGKKPVREVT